MICPRWCQVDIAVSFFAGFMTQWWLDMGVIGDNRDDCDINRVKSVTALLKSKAETVKNGNAARLDVSPARKQQPKASKCPFRMCYGHENTHFCAQSGWKMRNGHEKW